MNEVHNYSSDKQQAINEMLEMSKRAAKNRDTAKNANAFSKHAASAQSFTPFAPLNIDSDVVIILGLILILTDNNTDNLLLLALAYILS